MNSVPDPTRVTYLWIENTARPDVRQDVYIDLAWQESTGRTPAVYRAELTTTTREGYKEALGYIEWGNPSAESYCAVSWSGRQPGAYQMCADLLSAVLFIADSYLASR